MKHDRLLDRTFEISLILKGLDGVLELFGGVLLFFVSPASIQHLARVLTEHELSTDPHDFLATHLLHSAGKLTAGTTLFGAIYLFSHGLVKVVLVAAVLKEKLWAYPWMVAFLVLFIIYQIYRMVDKFSVALLLLTLFDAFIVWLTLLEYKKHRLKSMAV